MRCNEDVPPPEAKRERERAIEGERQTDRAINIYGLFICIPCGFIILRAMASGLAGHQGSSPTGALRDHGFRSLYSPDPWSPPDGAGPLPLRSPAASCIMW